MLIQAYRRKEPVVVELFGEKIEFELNSAGHCVAEVHGSPAIYRLLSITEAYRAYEGQVAEDQTAAPPSTDATDPDQPPQNQLLGSSVLPSEIELADDRFVMLSDVVSAAFERSGMTVAEWNAQDADRRESLFTDEITHLRAGLHSTDEDDLAQEEAERAATAKALADAEAAASGTGEQPPAQEPVSLVLTNETGETIDLST